MEEKQTSNKAIAKKRLSGRAVILIVCIAAVVLLAAGAAVLIFVWGRDSASGAAGNSYSNRVYRKGYFGEGSCRGERTSGYYDWIGLF